MTYKEMQKLMGLVQYAPEDMQDELAALLAKAASTKSSKIGVKPNCELAEHGYIQFSKKEICSMPDDIKKLFIIDNKIIKYRYHRGMYHARYRRDGYDIEVASKDFQIMKQKFIAALLEQTTHKPSKTPLMSDYLDTWLNEKKLSLKDGTYKSYLLLINNTIRPAFGHLHIDRIGRKNIQDFLLQLVEQDKNRTAHKVRQLLGAVFSIAVEDYDFKNPMIKVRLPHYEVKKGSPLSKAEEKKLIEFVKENRHLSATSSLLILLYTGMRIGELPSMTIENKDGYTYIECQTGKTRKGYAAVRRRIPISPMFRKVWDLIDFEKGKAAAPKTVQETLKRVFPDRHVHELRYSFISRCKECSCNLELVMLWDGHEFDKDVKSSKVDRGYTQYSDEVYFGDIEKVNYEL